MVNNVKKERQKSFVFFGQVKHLGIGGTFRDFCSKKIDLWHFSRECRENLNISGQLSRIFLSKMALFKNIVYLVRLVIFAQYRVHIARILKKNIAQA